MPKPGPGEVLLKMKAASLNYRDLLIAEDRYGGRFKLPLVPLSDGCGVVEEVGEGVTRVAKGDRVAPIFFQKWLTGEANLEGLVTSMGGPLDGCWQEYRVLSEQGVVKAPDHLSHAQVATLPCAALTAWRAIVTEGGIKAGDTILLQGTGGVSIFALQFAKAAGAEVIITSSSDEKLARAKALGADHVINYRETPETSKRVREITGWRGVDQVVEVGGAETLKEALKSIRLGGRISIIGNVSGNTADLRIGAVIATRVIMQGISVGSRDDFEAMNRAIALHKIDPVVDTVLPFDAGREAFDHMAAGKHFGKICIDLEA
jgi:NADPH:quinone reductase-like Zn-dependent oxidoreductase